MLMYEYSNVFYCENSGINTWLKLQAKMVAAIRGFDRSWESCKKKYKVIWTEYKNDKRANEISGSDRHQECKWFEQLDIWNSTRACVKNQIPASSTEGEDENDEDKGSSALRDREVTPKQDKKKKFQDKLEVILEKVVSNSSSFLTTFQESTTLLKNMDRHMAAILEKL
ncbi:MAG: hypothetical protein AVDCRST_MAG96-1567 [uncultured Segetibacter sp.]|uniref:Uncharacterized protein n=1 Tax=uncultured Segetibacter sp. TaxID=481133 RepID=A0A6J4S9D4_9BACT|nr:MAG: hypothetical protein AVDCRST_MAG96-1567 [uncultured Segetibacter sp.]